jgi:hypothetical protein
MEPTDASSPTVVNDPGLSVQRNKFRCLADKMELDACVVFILN